MKVAAIALIASGALALGYGGVTHARQSRQAPHEAPGAWAMESRAINVPAWAGGTTIVLGALLLAAGASGRRG